jgi:polyisoprenoid-binding protein YceI
MLQLDSVRHMALMSRAADGKWTDVEGPRRGVMRNAVLKKCVHNQAMAWLWVTSFVMLTMVPGVAQETAPRSLRPGDVNTEFSRVYIYVDRTTALGHSHGIEGKFKSGNMSISASATGELLFDMDSFDADTETARKVFSIEKEIDAPTRKKVNENMRGPEILDVKEYPEARLERATLTPTGKTSSRKLPEFLLEGDFTLHGTTRRIKALCDLEQKEGWHHVRGTFKILQSDFGIKPFSKMLGAVGIKDELVIFGDLWLVPAS